MRKYSTPAREGERVGRHDADVGLNVDERFFVESLGIDHGVEDVGEDLELVGDAQVVTVAGEAVADDRAARFGQPDLAGLERLDHPFLLRHASGSSCRT